MAATNTTTKKATTSTAKPAASTSAAASSSATTRTTSTSAAASNVSTSTSAAATNMKSSTPQTATQTPNTGLFSGLSLASFLGLPSVIDYQDIAIRVGLVLTGVILLILVGWAFVRGKQSTTVNVQMPHDASKMNAGEEAAEAAA